MQSYLDLLDNILTNGRRRETPRNRSYTLGIFGEQLRFDLSEGFPLVTTRKVPVRGIIEELLWFLSGSSDNNKLVAKNVHIWDHWAAREFRSKAYRKINEETMGIEHVDVHPGELGPIYGKMWRSWPNPDGTTTDQIATLLNNLKIRPYSRRHIISGWNPSLLPDETLSPIENVYNGRQCLPPCHTLFQFSVEPLTTVERMAIHDVMLGPGMWHAWVRDTRSSVPFPKFLDKKGVPKDRLSCKLHARSQDVPIGTVFNIASYAAMVLMICKLFNFAPGEYIHSMGDAHIYDDQIDLVKEQLKRDPRPLPTLKIVGEPESLFDYKISDFKLEGYNPHPVINYPITV